MKKRDFYRQFRNLLPDTLSQTAIDLNDVETTTLLFVGSMIDRMTYSAQQFYNIHQDDEAGSCDSFNDFLIAIVANKYKLEW